ncbi:MAG: hypothetical protein ACYDEX_03615 [Mobilitalea sp.]
MIYQYLYARSNEGYRQLNRWNGNPFRQEEMADMEALRTYNLTGGVTGGTLPECYYYYRSVCPTDTIGLVGKTSYVPQGSSRYSGDRETSFVHKYIFTEVDYEMLIQEPERIFRVKNYCSKVEDTTNYNDKSQDIFRSTKLVTPEQIQQLFNDINISEEDLINLIYALIDATGHVGKRVYIPLSSCDKKGSDTALKLCERLIMSLPSYIAAKCGFITYTNTFHNTTNNNIPSSITLIFFAPTESNIIKYESIRDDHYLFYKEHGYTSGVKMDGVTYSFLSLIKDKILCRKEDAELTEFYKKSMLSIKQDIPCTPEFLSYLKMFYEYDRAIRYQSNYKIIRNEELAQIFQCFKVNKEVISTEIQTDLIVFISELLLKLVIDRTSMELVSKIFGLVNQSDIEIIAWICNQMRDNPLSILQYECSNEELLSELYHTIYNTPSLYEMASIIIYHNIKARTESASQDNKDIIKQLFIAIDNLYLNYEGLARSNECISKIKLYLTDVLFSYGKLKNYNDINTLTDTIRLFIQNHNGCGKYHSILLEIIESAIDNTASIDQTSLDMISTWDKELLQNISTEKSKELQNLLWLKEWKELYSYSYNLEKITNKLISVRCEDLLSIMDHLLPLMYNMESAYKKQFSELKLQFIQYHAYIIIIMLSVNINEYMKQLSYSICNNVLFCEGLRGISELYYYVKIILDKARYNNSYISKNIIELQNLFRASIYYNVDLIKIKSDYNEYKQFLEEIHIPQYIYDKNFIRKTSVYEEIAKKKRKLLKHTGATEENKGIKAKQRKKILNIFGSKKKEK